MLNLGIIGTGMMAGIITNCCKNADINVFSILSRTNYAAYNFCKKNGIGEENGFVDADLFFHGQQLDAVYIASPTSEKEKFLKYCLKYDKHALIEKPLPNTPSMFELLKEADRKGLVWLDAAHFIHSSWYGMLDSLIQQKVGIIDRVEASFIWPDINAGQNKFNPLLEPDGVMGDLGWYPLRLISKFINCEKITKDYCFSLHNESNALIEFNVSGHTVDNITFIGTASYRGSVVKQRFEVSGSLGRISLNDFVMPYCGSFVYGSLLQDMSIHYEHGMKPLIDNEKIKISLPELQHITMLKNFTSYIIKSNLNKLKSLQADCLRTMHLSRYIRDKLMIEG